MGIEGEGWNLEGTNIYTPSYRIIALFTQGALVNLLSLTLVPCIFFSSWKGIVPQVQNLWWGGFFFGVFSYLLRLSNICL